MDPLSILRIRREISDGTRLRTDAKLRRVSCQISFAEALLRAHGRDDSPIQAAMKALDSDAELDAKVDAVEAALAPLNELAKTHRIHCVAHGHIDMNWMWSWPETVATTHDTFASLLSFMREYPDLTYSQSQASVYAIVERYHPDLFDEIKTRVAEGRWEVTAPHWVEGDKNCVGGESLAKHLLYTRLYFKDRFGLSPEDVPVDWEPDTFGHANTIPTIDVQGAVKYYYACRTGGGHGHERYGDERPPLYWWQGPDGARLLVNQETTWYNSYVNIGDDFASPAIAFFEKTGKRDWLNVFGVGNHGGGPTREEIDYVRETMSWPCWPKVEFSTARAYFEAVESDDLPVVDHELNFEFTGCYSTQRQIKQANKYGEAFCLEAESLALVEEALGGKPVPQDRLREAWIHVLFSQFHDILPGSGVAATRQYAMATFQETSAITGAVKKSASSLLGSRIDTLSLLPDTPEGRAERDASPNTPFVAGSGLGAGWTGFSPSVGGGDRFKPIIVWNPCAFKRSEFVEVVLYDLKIDPKLVIAYDAKGRKSPTTYLGEGWAWGHTKHTFLVPALDVPALGYATLLLGEGVPDADFPTVEQHAQERFTTPHLKLQVDRYSGVVAVEEPDVELGRWDYFLENHRWMTGWVIGERDFDCRKFRPKAFESTRFAWNDGTNNPSEKGAVAVTKTTLGLTDSDSRVEISALLHGLAPRVDFRAELDWREIGTPDKGVPTALVRHVGPEDTVLADTPFGFVDRTDCPSEEHPAVNLVHYANEDGSGLTVLQDASYGYQEDGFTVVRSSFDPDHAPEVAKTTVRYSYVLHETPPTKAELARLGEAFVHPMIAMPATFQTGDLPTERSFAQVSGEGVVLTSLKRGEEGGVIARLINYGDQATDAELTIDPTFEVTEAAAADLIERSTDEAKLIDDKASVRIPAKSFVTLKLT